MGRMSIPAVVCGILRLLALSFLIPGTAFAQKNQKEIGRVSTMPEVPSPFEMRDWKAVARSLDGLLFDFKAAGPLLPLIEEDRSQVNFGVDSFFLPSYVGNKQQAPGAQEAITTMAAVLGASLLGVDRSSQDGRDWVLGEVQYYNPVAGLIWNNVGHGSFSGDSFWYALLPTMLFFCLVDRYPRTADVQVPMAGGSGKLSMREIMHECALKYRDAAERMGDKGTPDFDYTSFDFQTMQPVRNGQWREPDSAAAIAWLEYMAWREFSVPRFLEAADRCLWYLDSLSFNPFYEALLPFGACIAARMNAEQGTHYNVQKLIDWCFGPSDARPGWGVISDRWGGYDVHGLVGSMTDGGGYAFAMNTFDAAAALVPLVRYDPRFARAIGKWMLNLANNARLFYGAYHPPDRQSSSFWTADIDSVIAYEGLRREWKGKSPYATGDAVDAGSSQTDFGLYGSTHVGFLASIVSPTSDPMILQLDLLATDFFHADAYPTFLYYNPHAEMKTIRIDVGARPKDLYSPTEKRFIMYGASGIRDVRLDPRSALVLVLAPSGGKAVLAAGRLLVNGVVVDYQPAAVAIVSPAARATVHDQLTVALDSALAPGVAPATVSLSVDGVALSAGISPTGKLVLDTTRFPDRSSHELSAVLESGNGVTARDSVSFIVDNRPLVKSGAEDFGAWKPWEKAPARLEIRGSAGFIIEDNPGGDWGAIVSPPITLAMGRAPVLVLDGFYPQDRWSLLLAFSGQARTLELVEPAASKGRIEVDLAAAVSAAAKKADVPSPIGQSSSLTVQLILATIGKGSRISFYLNSVDLVYREGR